MPQECINDKVFWTATEDKTLSPVVGQIPPFAKVAAITAPESAVTSIEHNCTETIKSQKLHIYRALDKRVYLMIIFLSSH